MLTSLVKSVKKNQQLYVQQLLINCKGQKCIFEGWCKVGCSVVLSGLWLFLDLGESTKYFGYPLSVQVKITVLKSQ